MDNKQSDLHNLARWFYNSYGGYPCEFCEKDCQAPGHGFDCVAEIEKHLQGLANKMKG